MVMWMEMAPAALWIGSSAFADILMVIYIPRPLQL